MRHIVRNWSAVPGRSNSFLLSIAATPPLEPPPPRLWMCGTTPPSVITRHMAITSWQTVLTLRHTKCGIYLTSDISLKSHKTHFSLNIVCVCVCVCVCMRTWKCKKHFLFNFCVHMHVCAHTQVHAHDACLQPTAQTNCPHIHQSIEGCTTVSQIKLTCCIAYQLK